MKFFVCPSSAVFLGLALIAFVSSTKVRGEAGLDRMRVDRWTQAGEPSEIDESTVQRIAEKVGPGHFFVTKAAVGGDPANRSTMVRLLAFYPATSSVRGQLPRKQVLLMSEENGSAVESGPPEALLAALSLDPIATNVDNEQVSAVTAEILTRALFRGEGRWLDDRDDGIFRPVVERSANGLAWKGFYLRRDGGIEELAVAFPSRKTSAAVVSRREIRPAGSFPVENKNELPVEDWTIAGGSAWRPSQRYKMMTTLAALGSPAKQFQLATALLQESADDARAEGMKWLRVAAAQGYRDAIDLMRQSGDELVRPDRDRDKVRLSRCCPVPGR